MTAKIAPTLVYAHKPVPTREIAQGRGVGIRSYHAASAWRELQALLAVARAAKYVLEIVQTCSCGCGEPVGSDKGNGGDECPMDGEMELDRALARLARVSGRSSRGARRRGRAR